MSWFKIFSAVVIGNVVSWIIITFIGWLVFFVALDSFNDYIDDRLSRELSAISAPLQNLSIPTPSPEQIEAKKERDRRLAIEQRRAKNEAERRRNAITQSRQMCDYWRAEYQKDRSAKSKGYRDMACSRLRKLINQG